ncbi:MAG: hypothetical protein ACI8UG_001735 [Gammaproteobacteria bacterium]|jgi:hypothetical protein
MQGGRSYYAIRPNGQYLIAFITPSVFSSAIKITSLNKANISFRTTGRDTNE